MWKGVNFEFLYLGPRDLELEGISSFLLYSSFSCGI